MPANLDLNRHHRIDPVSLRLHRKLPTHGPTMLMYHSVLESDARPRWPWAVSRSSFERQLDFLQAEGYATPTVSDLTAGPDRFHGRTTVISFDDGYMDNLRAAEALASRGMRATFYVVSGSIGSEPAWPVDGKPQGRLMAAAELRALQRLGMEIGSHAISHRRMTELDPRELRVEATESKAAIEDLLGAAVRSFAYPYGAFDEACVSAVRDAGYRSACTTAPGWMLRDGDPFRLRRLTVFNDDSLPRFARKLSMGSHEVSWPDIARYLWQRLTTA